MEHVLVAAKEHRVVEGRRKLARATTDVCRVVTAHDFAADDRSSSPITLRCGSFPCRVIDREDLSWHHPMSVDLISKKLNVDHTVFTAWVIRRER